MLIQWILGPCCRLSWQATTCNLQTGLYPISTLHRSPFATTTATTFLDFLDFLAPRSNALERRRIFCRIHAVSRSYTPKQSGNPDFVMLLRPVEGTLPLTERCHHYDDISEVPPHLQKHVRP